MPKTGQTLRCYFSLRSPYSWLAMRRLDRVGFGIGSDLAYIPYFEPSPEVAAGLRNLGGEFLYTAMGKARSLYILGDVKRSAQAEGLTIKWPVDRSPDWSLPHLAYLACDTPELRRAFAFAAMEARWLHGEDLWRWQKTEELLAATSGSRSAADIVAAARAPETAQQGARMLYQAYLDGVFGVPFLIAGRERFWGNDRVAPFLETVRQGAPA